MYEIISFKIFYIKQKIKFMYIRTLLRIYQYFKLPKKTKAKLGKKISFELLKSFKEVNEKCKFSHEELKEIHSMLKS
ncbi:hypothetical protein [Clostridium neonatale]|uniref:hypothetical protein n=1 Tax=Clostridium neonatale TaxID=137838 RepID=UPI00291BE4A0|nr:hypothetical protein [Clostridium neonatale]CAI3534824.1 hypothetical protein CNEO3_1080006 [Clostridium neonatale]CAI3685170.1 hypothetical protein CNEO4_590023 [Clostridium neonatale]